jgi:rhodanese-related sulfurtransferase
VQYVITTDQERYSMPETISPAELQLGISQKTPFRILDVRRKTDVESEPELIPGAVWCNPDEVEDWGSELPPTGEIIVYCARGGSVSKSILAALQAKKLAVRYVEGGLAGWRDSGGEVKRP